MSNLMISCDAYHATHVISIDQRNTVELVWVKYGFDEHGRAKKPSEGLFGCITASGTIVDGFHAWKYFRDPGTMQPPQHPDLKSAMKAFEAERYKVILSRIEYDWFDSQRQE